MSILLELLLTIMLFSFYTGGAYTIYRVSRLSSHKRFPAFQQAMLWPLNLGVVLAAKGYAETHKLFESLEVLGKEREKDV